ncbi:MAG: hypothetical protein II535_02980 [Bacteroidales bacterium]|nr:hypothetical protein [Bacteroidales bacterium]
MKKLVLFMGLTVLSFAAFAEKVPAVIVSKQHGGLSAIFNRYNHVDYTPADQTSNGIAKLDCYGSGFTACRVPICASLPVNDGSTVVHITDAGMLNAFLSAANNVVVQYESALEQCVASNNKPNSSKATTVPSVYTKTIAVANNNATTKADTYVVRGVVTSSTANASTMTIYIEKVNILSSLGH